MIVIPEQCRRCKHYQAQRRGDFCAAFPDEPGIPLPILDMDADHRMPFPGDHGIRWQPREPGIKHPFEEAA